MSNLSEAFVGLDTSKLRNAVAIGEGGRTGEIRFLGEIDNTPTAIAKLVRKLAAKYERLTFCYEAEPTGYGVYGRSRAAGTSALHLKLPRDHRGWWTDVLWSESDRSLQASGDLCRQDS